MIRHALSASRPQATATTSTPADLAAPATCPEPMISSLCAERSGRVSVPAATAEHEDGHPGAGGAQSHAEEQERWPSLLDGAGEDVEVLAPESSKEGDGQEDGGHRRQPAAHDRQVLAGE